MAKLRALGRENIVFLGYQEDSVLRDYLQRARGFVFAAEEDFGILPVEAQACGTPVIAYGAGGALETVLPVGNFQGMPATGVFFAEQTPAAVCAAISRFEVLRFDPRNCRIWAERFSHSAFAAAIYEQLNAMGLGDGKSIQPAAEYLRFTRSGRR
jgi:glycosyltransferase involved in cell wall biosynthesis